MVISLLLPKTISFFCHQRFPTSTDMECAHGARMRRLGKGHTNGNIFFADMRKKLFWRVIYCANPGPDAESQSGSSSCWGLGIRAPQIIREYDLMTIISIRLLIQPCICKIGSSIFAAMCRLKSKSTTRAYLPSML